MEKVFEVYQRFNYDLADPRINGFILMSSPFTLLTIAALYLWFCLKAGPHYMRDREPFQLKNILITYNLFQVLLNGYIFIMGSQLWIYMYSFKCAPVDYSHSPDALHVASLSHLYFLSKVIELLDTVFFVLRKKYSQVSALHVYHHTMMILMTWVFTKYVAGGHGALMGTLNSFVHVVMYFYYFIAALGPKYQKYLKWKKQLTIMQLVQFVLILIHILQALPRDCSYPKPFMWIIATQALLFVYLFSSFYVKTYIKPKNKEERRGDVSNNKKNVDEKKYV